MHHAGSQLLLQPNLGDKVRLPSPSPPVTPRIVRMRCPAPHFGRQGRRGSRGGWEPRARRVARDAKSRRRLGIGGRRGRGRGEGTTDDKVSQSVLYNALCHDSLHTCTLEQPCGIRRGRDRGHVRRSVGPEQRAIRLTGLTARAHCQAPWDAYISETCIKEGARYRGGHAALLAAGELPLSSADP